MTETSAKLAQLGLVIVAFATFVGLLLVVVDHKTRKAGRDRWQIAVFLAPAVLLMIGGLAYPAVRTTFQAFFDRGGTFVGLQNATWMFTQPEIVTVLLNSLLWVVLTPVFATAVGLAYAVAVDGVRGEALAKSLVFMPMGISFVGASIIWKFVYAYRPDQPGVEQIGLLNAVLVRLGAEPQQFLINGPWNTVFLIVVLVWIQSGFAMVVLSAALKGIPAELVEAARLDGATSSQVFRFVTLPSIRPALVVVVMTITIATLKVFDIVRTMTGGQFSTSVIANEMYVQAFRYGEVGHGAVLALFLFVLVLPLVVFQIRQIRKQQEVGR